MRREQMSKWRNRMKNPAREALTRAVNRAIDEGAPVYKNQPNLISMPTLERTEHGGHIKMRRTLPPGEGLVPAEIVLVWLPHNEITPYVTWQHNTKDHEGYYWGHYYREPDDALANFFKRGR